MIQKNHKFVILQISNVVTKVCLISARAIKSLRFLMGALFLFLEKNKITKLYTFNDQNIDHILISITTNVLKHKLSYRLV